VKNEYSLNFTLFFPLYPFSLGISQLFCILFIEFTLSTPPTQKPMQITIRVNEANQRFDRFLRKYFKTNKEVTLKDIYARIRKGAIKVNGKKAAQNYQLVMDDIVSFAQDAETEKEISHLDAPKAMRKHNISLEELKKQVLREDDNRIVRNKSAGIVIHEGNFHTNDINLNDYLESYLKFQKKADPELSTKPDEINIRTRQIFKPAFAFRLDKDTSGVIVGAKTYDALKYLNKAIHDREVNKTYLVIVAGRFPKHLLCEEPLSQKLDQRFGRNKTVVDRKE
jgi:23S rRNA pseudouridine955/2504/2580 synthase